MTIIELLYFAIEALVAFAGFVCAYRMIKTVNQPDLTSWQKTEAFSMYGIVVAVIVIHFRLAAEAAKHPQEDGFSNVPYTVSLLVCLFGILLPAVILKAFGMPCVVMFVILASCAIFGADPTLGFINKKW